MDIITIQNWERGIWEPTIRLIPRIIEFLQYDPEPVPTILAKKIGYVRRRLGLTQEDLAKAISVGTFAIWQWESGRTIPPHQQLEQIQFLLQNHHIRGITLQ